MIKQNKARMNWYQKHFTYDMHWQTIVCYKDVINASGEAILGSGETIDTMIKVNKIYLLTIT